MLNSVSEIGIKLLLITFVLALLPQSPFTGFAYLVQQIPFLNWVNWLLPVSEILAITETWLVVVTAYYGILYILNYTGLIKS